MATIRKRGNTFQIRVSLGCDTTGKQIVKTATFKPEPYISCEKAEKQAKAFAEKFEQKCHSGGFGDRIKFEECAEIWLEDYAKLNLRKTSYDAILHRRKRVYKAIGYIHD